MPIYGAQQNPYLVPATRDVTAVTNGNPAQVTTYEQHGYYNGAIVRLYIPVNFGMTQANYLKGAITILDDYNFYMAIDTTMFDPFVVPPEDPGFNYTPAQVVNVGEEANTLQSAFQNILQQNF